MDEWWQQNLVCPRDHHDLRVINGSLECDNGHRYPVIDGVPVMLIEEARQTMEVSTNSLRAAAPNGVRDGFYLETLGCSEQEKNGIREAIKAHNSHVDPVVRYLVAATNGNLYRSLVGPLNQYPIPSIRLPPGNGSLLLDLGCNWGRWSMAAARIGYDVVGLDPSLGSIMAARRAAKKLQLPGRYLVADARYLPFRSNTFSVVFSYSVLQHFSKPDSERVLIEIMRALEPGGQSLIQMANAFGLRSIYVQTRRGFREPRGFEVRYWRPNELLAVFTKAIGNASLSIDGYFGLGVQASDKHLLPIKSRAVITASQVMHRFSERFSWLQRFADSLYVTSRKPQ